MIANFIIRLINLIISALGKVAETFLILLPDTPFDVLEGVEIPYLNYLNWVIPFDFMVTVFGFWVGAIGLYYVVQVVLRWLKVVSS